MRQTASDFCNNFIDENRGQWREFFQLFANTQNEQTQYWLLLALTDIVKKYWGELSKEDKEVFISTSYDLLKTYQSLIVPKRHF